MQRPVYLAGLQLAAVTEGDEAKAVLLTFWQRKEGLTKTLQKASNNLWIWRLVYDNVDGSGIWLTTYHV